MAGAEIRLRVVSRIAPHIFDGRETEFGLQDKKKQLTPGRKVGDRLHFDVAVPVKQRDTGEPRFGGPFVHAGAKGAQHLYVGWRYAGADVWINRLKVHLNMTWDDVARALADDATLVTNGTVPEWGVLKDWHGLNVGKNWERG